MKKKFNYLRSRKKIHFEEASLQRSFCRSVVLQGVQKEGSARLDHVLFQENVDNLTNIGQWLVVLDKHLGKHAALFRADTHDATQQENVVGCVADFLGVQDDLLELASLRKAL